MQIKERSAAKNCCPVNLLSVVCKAFEKLVNNRIADHLEKCGLFQVLSGDFQHLCDKMHTNNARCAMVCDVYFYFLKFYTLLKGLCAYG